MTYTTRITQMTVVPDGGGIYNEMAITIGLDTNGDDEFVVVSQPIRHGAPGEIAIDRDEWPTLRDAIDRMVLQCLPAAAGPVERGVGRLVNEGAKG